MRELIVEMRRRRVFRGAGVAVIVSWLIYILASPTGDLALLMCWLFVFAVIMAGVFSWLFRVRPGEFMLEEAGSAAPPVTQMSRLIDRGVVAGLIIVGLAATSDITNASYGPEPVERERPSRLFMPPQ